MKGRHPGARVLIATTWSEGEGGRPLSESANQTCNWEMVGVGGAVRVQRRRRTGARAAGLEGGYRCPEWHGHWTAPVPHSMRPLNCGPPGSPTASAMQSEPLETAREERPLETSQKFLKEKIQFGALIRVFTFLSRSKRRD